MTMKQVHIHRFVGEPSKKTGLRQVTVLIGEGANRRSFTCHPHRGEGKTLVGNNPDPTTVSRREQAAKLVANANANYDRLQAEIVGFEKLLARELTTDELEMFRRQGFTTAEKIKKAVEVVVIPTLKLQLQTAKMACDTAKAFQAEVDAAFPLTVEFVGL